MEERQVLEQLSDILKNVKHPDSQKDLVSAGIVKEVLPPEKEGERIQISLALGQDRKLQLAVEAQIRTAIAGSDMPDLRPKIRFINNEAPQAPQPSPARKLDHIKYIVAVGSGKGGVGKSTVAVNLAAGLAEKGLKVGLLDADIYGPSVGKLVSLKGKVNLVVKKNRIIPVSKYKMKIISFSFLVDEAQAIVWRGPMLGKAIEQFLYDIEWGELDYLIIDLPPGTGDVQLSLGQLVEVHGAILITTPQDVAAQDAFRAAEMFSQVNIPIIGVIENMSQFICPHCHEGSEVFSQGGGKRLSSETDSTLLAQIPLTLELMNSCEEGIPLTSSKIKKLKVKPEALKPTQDSFDQAIENVTAILDEAYQRKK